MPLMFGRTTANSFTSNYDCTGGMDEYLTIADGVNNLGSIGWGTSIHGLRCRNFDPGDA